MHPPALLPPPPLPLTAAASQPPPQLLLKRNANGEFTCPVEGCFGIGHINGRSKTHFNPRYCPKLSMSERMKYGKSGELLGSNTMPTIIKPSLVRKRRRLLTVRSDEDDDGDDNDYDDDYGGGNNGRGYGSDYGEQQRKRIKYARLIIPVHL